MNKKILVIDDEEMLTRTFSRLFRKRGHEVFVANRAAEALEAVRQTDFDLILSDVRMPGVNGVDLCRQIRDLRSGEGKKPVPVIFLTGFADETIEAEAKQLNPVAYVYKPCDMTELINLVDVTFQTH
ncbi:MAG: response regulator [Candidatus Omnitrophica bacterium]|nr:response regulator [Candidatus Omnitrophota bacterium]MDD5671251.1 response regulator [Candidatus Omnitrophota bacterium]